MTATTGIKRFWLIDYMVVELIWYAQTCFNTTTYFKPDFVRDAKNLPEEPFKCKRILYLNVDEKFSLQIW